jgi:hypothetical protein
MLGDEAGNKLLLTLANKQTNESNQQKRAQRNKYTSKLSDCESGAVHNCLT